MLYALVLTLIFCLAPAGVIWLCRRFPLLDSIGPIMILYAIGMLIGNLPLDIPNMATIQKVATEASIPLAIPMMLYGCSFSRREAGLQCKIVVSGFLSVALAVTLGYLFFGRNVNEGAQVGGIIAGMYTGGTINAAALQAIFRIDSENYILMSSYDIVISFLYLVFLLSVGIPMFRRLYGEGKKEISQSDQEEINRQIEKTKENPYRKLLSREGMRQLGKALLLTIGIVAVSGGVALLLPDDWFMVVFILLITTLGVVASFFPAVRKLDTSYDAGMYLIYIFSITIASMADFSNLRIDDGLNQIIFLSIAVFGSLLLHAIFCRIMRVDADSMVISSVAFINSPPFVPMAAAVMKNRNALVTGLAAGVAGYALGNHFGVLMEKLLSLL